MRLLAAILATSMFTASIAAGAPQPWEQNVSASDQDSANALFKEASDLYAQEAYPAALDRYQKALAIWDHPAIRFNMAVTLVALGRELEAAEALEVAMKYGPAPFSKDDYRRVLEYKRLINLGVGEIDVSCAQAGTTIALDGAALLTCPGTQTKRVRVGDHTVLGERSDLVPETRHITVSGGASAKIDVELQTLEKSIALEYPTRRWIPWSVAGAGVVVSAIGVVLLVSGHSDRSDVVADIDRTCGMGCTDEQRRALDDRLDSAQLKGNFGVATLVVGGLVLAGGVTWTILNRPHNKLPRLEVAPAQNGTTASASWSF